MDRGGIKGKWGHNGNTGMSMCGCVCVSIYVEVFKGYTYVGVTGHDMMCQSAKM